MRGGTTDGNRYIQTALQAGAAGIVTDSPETLHRLNTEHPETPRLLVDHGRTALAELSSAFFGHPEKKLHATGVTGTITFDATALTPYYVLVDTDEDARAADFTLTVSCP